MKREQLYLSFQARGQVRGKKEECNMQGCNHSEGVQGALTHFRLKTHWSHQKKMFWKMILLLLFSLLSSL